MELLRRHGWWLAATFGVAIALAVVVEIVGSGGFLLVIYAAVNATGTWLVVDGQIRRHRHHRPWWCWATIAQLPVGILGVLGMRAPIEPSRTALARNADGSGSHISEPPPGGAMGRTG